MMQFAYVMYIAFLMVLAVIIIPVAFDFGWRLAEWLDTRNCKHQTTKR